MNRRDDHAGHLLATDSEEGDRSSAYGQLTRDLLRANEQACLRAFTHRQARAQQYL